MAAFVMLVFAWLVITFLPHTPGIIAIKKKCQIKKKNVIYVQKEMLFIMYNHVNKADTHALLIVIRRYDECTAALRHRCSTVLCGNKFTFFVIFQL